MELYLWLFELWLYIKTSLVIHQVTNISSWFSAKLTSSQYFP